MAAQKTFSADLDLTVRGRDRQSVEGYKLTFWLDLKTENPYGLMDRGPKPLPRFGPLFLASLTPFGWSQKSIP